MGGLPTPAEYERDELRAHVKRLEEIEAAPLAERREARDAWTRAMIYAPALVGERAAWLLQGAYGHGACQEARRIQTGTLRNKVAALAQLVAALEWQCPRNMAASAWRKLTTAQQRAVNKAIEEALKTDTA